VILAMLVAQALILLLAGACFESEAGSMGVLLALGAFFFLALQSTFYSPAKMGILKELAGSRRLGMAAGVLQLVTMVGILAGLGVGGAWFDAEFAATGNAWQAAATPIWWLFGVAVLALVAGRWILPTPAHAQVRYRHALWWEHFRHLRECLAQPPMRRAFLGNSTYWFVASMAAAMFVDIGLALHPDPTKGGAAGASAHMTLMVGLGTVAGSLFVAWVNRRGPQLGLIPAGALGLAAALFWTGFMPVDSPDFGLALALIGFAGGCFMVPIQAFIQDQADPDKRGRVLASMNLLDSLAGVVAVLCLILLKMAGLGFRGQFWALAALMVVASVYVVRLLPHYLLRFVLLLVVRLVYKVRSEHQERVPKNGGVLLLANHVSYMDAFVFGAACERPVRFVMWDALYNLWPFTPLLRIVGTVPISPTRAKDAIRAVSSLLREGRIVALFPEGQITRHGMVNELRKGYEVMARQGDAVVVPVYLDGLYGSYTSFEGGHFFNKWPRRLRYPVKAWYGTPLAAREATSEAVRRQILSLSAEALLARRELAREEDPRRRVVLANAMRLREVEWVRAGETLVTAPALEEGLLESLRHFAAFKGRGLRVAASPPAAGSWVFVASRVEDLASAPAGARLTLLWTGALEVAVPAGVLRGWLDERSGELIAVSVPDPVMPEGEEGGQPGWREGALGRLLPGIAYEPEDDGVRLSGLAAGGLIKLAGMRLDEQGFLMPHGR
jgi:acyl-[acyl-carrier-protein]-phospholipid O-acyltransferase/long-chain-fatty-acid--[acyl-carrier-protein] ligase